MFVRPAVSAGLLVFICIAAGSATELMSPATQLGHKNFMRRFITGTWPSRICCGGDAEQGRDGDGVGASTHD